MSKPIIINDNTELNVEMYVKGELSIKQCKLTELKTLARHLKLRVSGTKPELLRRLETWFYENKKISSIQALFRGHLVRFSIKLRGCALNKRTLCVNDSDFYTLDPLNEIDYSDFYSYVDKKGFIYGFSVSSLITLFKQKGHITNPYNREKLDFKTMNEIFILYKLNSILYPPKQIVNETTNANQIVQVASQPELVSLGSPNTHIIIPVPVMQPLPVVIDIDTTNNNSSENELRQRMHSIQSRPTRERIRELFMEMDQLGNYTNENWFTDLGERGLDNLYNHLFDIWEYRAQLSQQIKNNICGLGNPFSNMRLMHPLGFDRQLNGYRNKCLFIMEHMVFTGRDAEYQKLGTLHVLSAFTIVSLSARQAMPWLYEGLMY